jgi:hypothetical protein
MGRTYKTTQPDSLAIAVDVRNARALALRSLLLKLTLVATGVGVLTASAWISVPFFPVPITMQTLAVLLIGGLLGPRLGVAAVTSYIGIGLAGAPVFHNALAGPALLAGPTGGYLIGFIPAAFFMGLASRRGWTPAAGRLGVIAKVAYPGWLLPRSSPRIGLSLSGLSPSCWVIWSRWLSPSRPHTGARTCLRVVGRCRCR